MYAKYIVDRIPHTNSKSNYKQEELRNSYEKGAKMKATGIVRRIEECVIIGQTAPNPHKH